MAREFQIVREIAREEVERSTEKRLIGLTASAPRFIDVGGVTQYVVDVRIGRKENQGLIRDVLVSQWAFGAVTDINVPVVLERSEGGQLTVISRSMIRLPNVRASAHNFAALDMVFAANLVEQEDGSWLDAFGFPATDPTVPITVTTNWEWIQGETTLDLIGDELVETTTSSWVEA